MLTAIVLIPFNLDIYVKPEKDELISILAIVVPFCNGFLQVYSGIVLLKAIIKIKTLYKQNEEVDRQLNTQALLVHASSFGLYLVSTAMTLICYAASVLWPLSTPIETIYMVTNSIWAIMSFIS